MTSFQSWKKAAAAANGRKRAKSQTIEALIVCNDATAKSINLILVKKEKKNTNLKIIILLKFTKRQSRKTSWQHTIAETNQDMFRKGESLIYFQLIFD